MSPRTRLCYWWRRGRVELPVQERLPRIYYKLSQVFSLTRLTSSDGVQPGQSIFSFTALIDVRAVAP